MVWLPLLTVEEEPRVEAWPIVHVPMPVDVVVDWWLDWSRCRSCWVRG